jgi:hypothetical protein
MYVVCVPTYTGIYVQPDVRSRFENCTFRTQICHTSLHNPPRCTEIEGFQLLYRGNLTSMALTPCMFVLHTRDTMLRQLVCKHCMLRPRTMIVRSINRQIPFPYFLSCSVSSETSWLVCSNPSCSAWFGPQRTGGLRLDSHSWGRGNCQAPANTK